MSVKESLQLVNSDMKEAQEGWDTVIKDSVQLNNLWYYLKDDVYCSEDKAVYVYNVSLSEQGLHFEKGHQIKAIDVLNIDLNYQVVQQPHIVNDQDLILCLCCNNKVLKSLTENIMTDSSVTDVVLMLLVSESVLKIISDEDYSADLLRAEAE